jgi:hypothetical protein
MTQFTRAARSPIRNIVLCTLAALTLAACGDESGSTAAAPSTASDTAAGLVSPNVGFIDRSEAVGTLPSSGTGAGSGSTSTSGASSTSGTGTTTTSGTTVASGGKVTSPVKSTTSVATLDWLPPTENSDGSVLINLAGYTVYYGTSADNLTQSVKLTNPGLTSYTVTNLPSGTWYFAVTAYTADGVESLRTSVISSKI